MQISASSWRLFEKEQEFDVTKVLPEEKDETDKKAEKLIICKSCGHGITREKSRISMQGSHEHLCTNPHGIQFQIGCFGDANGVTEIGAATDKFTWFPGYEWKIGLCAGCRAHIGWGFYSLSAGMFYGLILDRLASPH